MTLHPGDRALRERFKRVGSTKKLALFAELRWRAAIA